MDWNALKYFLAVAEETTLAAAAAKLKVSHSTIFRRIQAFEAEIGGRLFSRAHKHYVLTPLGEELLEIGQGIHGAFDDIERHIIGKDLQPKGLVRVSAQSYLASNYLTGFLAEFHRQYPEVELELISENYEPNLGSLEVDVAVRVFPEGPPDYLVGRQACAVQWGVYASKGYIEQLGQPKSIENLGNHQLIGGASFLREWPGFVWLDKYYSDSIVARCNELNAMHNFANHHHGLAFLPNDKSGRLTKVLDYPPGGTASLWVLTHPDLRKVKRIGLIMRHLVEKFSGLNL